MTEEKIKLKDLVTELHVMPKDVLRVLRDMGQPARNTTVSVSVETAERLRNHFTGRQPATEKQEGAPKVIVRRRKREQEPESAPPEPVAEKEVPNVEATPPEEPAVAESAQEDVQPESPAPVQEKKPARKPVINVGARVISRPGDKQPEPEPEPAPRPVVPEKPAPPVRTLAQEIREREARERAQEREERKALRKKMERAASVISKPEPVQEKPAEPVAVEQPEAVAPKDETPRESPVMAAIRSETKPQQEAEPKQPRPVRNPAASASPTGSSAPGISQAGRRKGNEADNARQEEPRVRIISKPAANAPRRPGETRAAPGRGEKPQGDRSGLPGRSQGNRQAFGQPFGGGRGMQPQPEPQLEARDGQGKKKRLKGRRTVEFQQGDFGRHSEEDENMHLNRGKPRRRGSRPQAQPQPVHTQPVKAAKRKIRVEEAIRVADMAHQLGVKANEIIKVLFGLGVMATINQSLDIDTATLVASEFGYEVEKAGFSEEDYLAPRQEDSPESLKPRPPVVTIMGHVDHGKTSLLDAIRKSNITSGEAGGITQHIGAYHVRTRRGEIVFLDTPGHEAFTAMRARGANITDLVILVVAADDGVMEQTREAISHARAANVPIMVAVNKMDKPGADPDRVLRELSELGLQPEEWGGDTIVARVSAKTREGLDDLLEMVALQSEIMELKANPDKPARGHIVEARLDKGRGPIATVLIQEGTLHTGDNFVCGPFAGRVRALTSDQGKKIKEAGPSIPVEVQGFDGVPEAGEEFMVVADEKLAKRIADSRASKLREHALARESRVTLETFLADHGDQEALTLNLVLKADVQGSLEAITEALQKQNTDKVKINIVHGGTGAINESDILLASTSKAIIIGFNVRPTARIKDIAERENVDIRYYDIIYKLVDDIKSAMAGLLAPVQREVYLGQAEVRQVYVVPRVGAIAGSYVSDGKVVRNAGVRILRDGIVIYTGKISSLKRFKDDAREVVKGNECGIGLENFNDIKVGDILEDFETVEEAATL